MSPLFTHCELDFRYTYLSNQLLFKRLFVQEKIRHAGAYDHCRSYGSLIGDRTRRLGMGKQRMPRQ